MKKLILVLLLGLLGATLWFFLQREDTKSPVKEQNKPTTATVAYVVPPMPKGVVDFLDGVTYVPIRPWANNGEMLVAVDKALNLIESMSGHPELQTQDDFEIQDLVKVYRTHPMRIVPAGGDLGENVVFGYNCSKDFFIAGSLYIEPELMAVTMYHEMVHKVYCERQMKQQNLPRERLAKTGDLCQNEAPADAAGSRMFLALWQAGKLPRKIARHSVLGDPASNIVGAWMALLKGYGQYCDGLQQQYSGREDLLLQH